MLKHGEDISLLWGIHQTWYSSNNQTLTCFLVGHNGMDSEIRHPSVPFYTDNCHYVIPFFIKVFLLNSNYAPTRVDLLCRICNLTDVLYCLWTSKFFPWTSYPKCHTCGLVAVSPTKYILSKSCLNTWNNCIVWLVKVPDVKKPSALHVTIPGNIYMPNPIYPGPLYICFNCRVLLWK